MTTRIDVAGEARRLGAAVQFLTRLPVRGLPFEPDWLPRSAKYFPLVGAGIGLASAVALVVAAGLWPGPIPALLALATSILLTGALHDDGLADTADSLGGRTREARLAIMKDPRMGTFGILALGLTLGLRVAALAAMPVGLAAAGLVAAAAGGRLMPVVVMWRWPYGGDPAASRGAHAEDRPRAGEVALGAAIAAAALLATLTAASPVQAACACVLGVGGAALVVARTCPTLGGYTGDVLGATVVVFETGFLLGFLLGVPSAR